MNFENWVNALTISGILSGIFLFIIRKYLYERNNQNTKTTPKNKSDRPSRPIPSISEIINLHEIENNENNSVETQITKNDVVNNIPACFMKQLPNNIDEISEENRNNRKSYETNPPTLLEVMPNPIPDKRWQKNQKDKYSTYKIIFKFHKTIIARMKSWVQPQANRT